MAVPARESAAAQEPPEPEGKPGPLFWADTALAVTASARTAAMVAEELARDPGNGAALAMAGLLVTALDSLGGITGRLADAEQGRVLDETALEAEGDRRYAEGYAACKADRCRMGVIGGGQPG